MAGNISAGSGADLIAAVATPPGQGGVGIVRLSGPGAAAVAEQICGRKLQPRQAMYCNFSYADEIIDQGLALWFPGEASFTGEEVVELQAHGSPVVLQRLLDAVCEIGARIAHPGEFSERAFLNGKIDLAQAEAIADLIASTSVAASRAAMRSLQGAFSSQIHEMSEHLASLRVLVEACIDFPDEDVEFLQAGEVAQKIERLLVQLDELRRDSAQGQLLNEGLAVALIGSPNAGKSSLLNVLSGEDAAIVTDIPGTTRDLLKVDIVLDGLPLRLVDTAGLRESEDQVERIGVERAISQARQADLLLLILDATTTGLEQIDAHCADLLSDIEHDGQVLVILNKVDLLDDPLVLKPDTQQTMVAVSAKTHSGMAQLRNEIVQAAGFATPESAFTARARHVEALDSAIGSLQLAQSNLSAGQSTEIVAEELRAAHNALGEIVGTVTPDDLLGKIFSEFCIGK